MQSASDIFLGWAKGPLGRHGYIRQLRDMKMGAQTELFSPGFMVEYAEACGWTLARAHARSGDSAKLSGYLGKSDVFDEAIATFASAYADQSERDHAILKKAARSGRVEVVMERE
jgi:sugar/nucleoside kinase (ribokinase family)